MKLLKSNSLTKVKDIKCFHDQNKISLNSSIELLKQCKCLIYDCLMPYQDHIEYNTSGIDKNTIYSNYDNIIITLYQPLSDSIIYVKAVQNSTIEYYILKLTKVYIQKITRVWFNWQHVTYSYEYDNIKNRLKQNSKNNNNFNTTYQLLIDNDNINYSKLEVRNTLDCKGINDNDYSIPMLEIF